MPSRSKGRGGLFKDEQYRLIRSASRASTRMLRDFEQTTPPLRGFPSLLRRGMVALARHYSGDKILSTDNNYKVVAPEAHQRNTHVPPGASCGFRSQKHGRDHPKRYLHIRYVWKYCAGADRLRDGLLHRRPESSSAISSGVPMDVRFHQSALRLVVVVGAIQDASKYRGALRPWCVGALAVGIVTGYSCRSCRRNHRDEKSPVPGKR
jgi:hypothetical protein